MKNPFFKRGGADAATESLPGIVPLASNAETIAGTESAKAVTPAGLTAKIDTDTALAGNLDTRIPSQKAVKAYVDAKGIPVASAGGTVDAITADYTPDIALTDQKIVAVVALGANTSATPTFAPDGLTARTIVKKGGQPLVAGDIPGALAVCLLEYNAANTRWELLNPASQFNPASPGPIGGSTPSTGNFTSVSINGYPMDVPPTPGVIMPMGTPGAGVGICPASKIPTGYAPMTGYADRMSPNFGNYQYLDGSVVVFRPKYYYKIGTGTNGLAVNQIDIQGIDTYPTTALANAAGYALCRSFIDGGVEIPGKFDDKYMCSKTQYSGDWIASSIKNGLPLSTAAAHNPIADLTACSGSNTYADTIRAAKARNAYSYCMSVFDDISLARISMAHGQKSFGPAYCAWYSTTKNYPKGCNNNALADTDDTSVLYISDGYSNCGKTGSAWFFDKTTHNGQACGVADLNGLMYETRIGLTCIATTASISAATKANPCQITTSAPHGKTGSGHVMITGAVGMTEINDKIFTYTYVDASNITLNCDSSAFGVWSSGGTLTFRTFYIAKQSTEMKAFTYSNSGATDHWGATGVAAMMQAIDPVFKTTYPNNGFAQRWGSGTNQVLSEATSGDAWLRSCCGFPKDANGIDATGTDLFGKDYFYQYIRDDLCVLGCCPWSNTTNAGVWARNWSYHRAASGDFVGFRCSACSLV